MRSFEERWEKITAEQMRELSKRARESCEADG